MTVVTVRPNSTVAHPSTGVVATPSTWTISSGTVHGVLASNSDSDNLQSVVNPAYESNAVVRCPNPTIPAGGVLIGYRVRVRQLSFDRFPYYTFVTLYDSYAGSTEVNYLGVSGAASRRAITPQIGAYTTQSSQGLIVPKASSYPLPTYLDVMLSGSCGVDHSSVFVTELYVDAVYAAKPVVDPLTPTGTITDTNTPLITWSNTLDSDGGAQAYYEVKIFNDAQYLAGGFDPSTSNPYTQSFLSAGSGNTWQTDVPLPDDTYRTYVRVAQIINGELHYSDWAYEGFVINVPDPGVPTLAVVAEGDHVKITATATAGGSATDNFRIQRSADGGSTWEDLRTLLGDGLVAKSGSTGVAYDHETDNGVTAQYRARAVTGTVSPVSDWSSTASVTWRSEDWWLKHPTDPRLNLAVLPFSEPGYDQETNVGYLRALGSRLPISITDLRSGRSGTIVLELESPGDLDDLLDDGSPLLLQAPEGHSWDQRWVLLDRQTSTRLADKLEVPDRLEGLHWVEVAAPGGNVVSEGWA